jgi:hypothetical protein
MIVDELSPRSASCFDTTVLVPSAVVWQARAAFDTRTSSPLAALVYDSALDGNPAAAEREVRFEHASVRVELLISGHGHVRRLRGRVDPPRLRVKLELITAPFVLGDTAIGDAFAFDAVPRGVMRLRLVEPGSNDGLYSDWFLA